MDNISQTRFSNAFHLTKMFQFRSGFHLSFPFGYNERYSNFVSDNGLAPNKRKAIIWTNADPIHWRIHPSQVGDGLMKRLRFFLCISVSGRKKCYLPVAFGGIESIIIRALGILLCRGVSVIVIGCPNGIRINPSTHPPVCWSTFRQVYYGIDKHICAYFLPNK